MIDIKQMLAAAREQKEEGLRVSSAKSRDQNRCLICENDQGTYRLNSAYRPLEEAARWASQYRVVKKRAVVYLFGLGNGYFARELFKNLRTDSRLIILEPSYAIFSHAAETYDLSALFSDERTVLFLGGEGAGRFLAAIEQYVHWTNLASQMVCIHPGYDRLFPKELAQYEAMLSHNNEKEIRNRNTEAFFGQKRTENVLRNLKSTREFYVLSDFYGCFPKEVPAVLVAAGPSLDKNVEQLKRIKGKAFILACDTALRYLYRHGVQPDAAITVDANKPERYFENAGFEDLPVITTATANYDALKRNAGARIWYSGQSYHIELLKTMGIPLSYRTGGGSVATAAFAVCASLGFSNIILIGQDLAYGQEATHAGGEVSRIRQEEEGIVFVKGIDGTMQKSRRDWASFLSWYAHAIKSLGEGVQVIDATEGGAYIEGTIVMPLLEAAGRYCRTPFSFAKLLQEKNPYQEAYVEQIDRYLRQSHQDAGLLSAYCKRSAALASRHLDALDEAEGGSFAVEDAEIAALNQKIQRLPVYALVDEYARKETMAFVQEGMDASLEETADRSGEYRRIQQIHQALAKAAEEVKKLL